MSRDSEPVHIGELVDEAFCRLISADAAERYSELKREFRRRVEAERRGYHQRLRYLWRHKVKPEVYVELKEKNEVAIQQLNEEFQSRVNELLDELTRPVGEDEPDPPGTEKWNAHLAGECQRGTCPWCSGLDGVK